MLLVDTDIAAAMFYCFSEEVRKNFEKTNWTVPRTVRFNK